MAKYNVVYDEFKDLWLRDDPEWVENRKKLFKKVLKNKEEYRRGKDEALYTQQFKHYFVYGELLKYPDLVVKNAINGMNRLLCVPWCNREELESVFHYRLHTGTTRIDLATRFSIIASYYFRGLPDQWLRIQLFCDVIFGNEYKELKAPETPGSSHMAVVSPDPLHFVQSYISSARNLLLKGNKNSVTWLNYSFDYFRSCMSHIVKEGAVLDNIVLKLLFESFEYIEEVRPELDQYQQDVFDKVHGFMMSEAAPKFIVEFRENYSSED